MERVTPPASAAAAPMPAPAPAPMPGISVYDTTGRTLRLLRGVLAVLQRLWPRLAVRLALRLFSTPMPPRWLQRGAAPWGAAWRTEQWPFENGSITAYLPAAVAPEPVVLLVHGWGGDAGHMRPLAEALAREGLQSVLLDMPAHGRSRGRTSHLPQFARAIAYAAARLAHAGHPLQAVVAHSLGGNAVAYAASHGLAAPRLVLLAPPASPHEFTRLFAHVFALSEVTRRAMQQRLEASEGIHMRDFEPPAVGPRIAAPVLVMHDRDDRVNRFVDGQAFAHAVPQGQLVETQGLGHRKLLKDADVLARVVAFVR